ncbi:MAG: beta-lactamase-like protein with penicillin binding protein transpeptidase domain [Gallionellaceae bacterium]|nr:MAG: beta-lactamase-like protein with penicillin binding protein transpeptidase domain [Gallionellaceae bacterium]
METLNSWKRRSGWFAASGLILLLLAGWMIVAGPTTVYRTLRYNFSGIDDYRIFPQRVMSASAQPFRFAESKAGNADPHVRFGAKKNVHLSDLLNQTDTTAFLLIKDDRIVTEYYPAGYSRATPSMSFSMAKSFFSILVGCAIADGYFKSIDQPVTDFVPELSARGFSAVTLKHLLQMTSGMDYPEPGVPLGLHDRFYYTDHLEQETLKLELKEPPGTRFEYKSGDVFLLTLALERALDGKSISVYMQERLWQPLGMEHDGIWSIDHAPDGLEKTGCCLAATARDFAKFGRLYLNQGKWEGKQIVPADWVKAANQVDLSIGSIWNYQRLWWRVAPDRPDFMANGHLGQFLYINPATNTAIVRLGKSMGSLSRDEWAQVFISLSEGDMK